MVHTRSVRAARLAASTRPTAHSSSPARIAIAGDGHADADYGAAAVDHAAKHDASVLLNLGEIGPVSRGGPAHRGQRGPRLEPSRRGSTRYGSPSPCPE